MRFRRAKSYYTHIASHQKTIEPSVGQFKFRYLVSPKEFLAWAKFPDPFALKLLANTIILQYMTFQFFAVSVLLAMPVKLLLRLVFTIKYVWVTPWFNV